MDERFDITWMGTASVKLEAATTTVLIDPYIELPGAENPNSVEDFLGADAILITHGHVDHLTSLPTILESEIMRGRGSAGIMASIPQIYCTATPARTLRRMTRNLICGRHLYEFLHVIAPGDEFTVGDVSVRVLPGKHIKFDAPLIGRTLLSPRMWELRRNMSELGKYFVTCPEVGETVIYELSACGKRVLDMGSLGIAEMPDAAQNAQGAAVESAATGAWDAGSAEPVATDSQGAAAEPAAFDAQDSSVTSDAPEVRLIDPSALTYDSAKDADVLLMPYQGSSDLVSHARPVLETLRPRRVVLTHFDDAFPPLSSSVDTAGIFEMAAREFPGMPVVKPVAGQPISV